MCLLIIRIELEVLLNDVTLNNKKEQDTDAHE